MLDLLRSLREKGHKKVFGILEVLKYIGPGLLVTVGFIDPGNWASNLAAGSQFGYTLLWMVTLSTLMLILLQHNAAHLGIASGLCLSEAAAAHLPRPVARAALWSAMAASVCTSLAEILGGALALNMLLGLPVRLGAVLTAGLVVWLLLSNGYRSLERWIIGFVSLIGLALIYELALVPVDWGAAAAGWTRPSFPPGSIVVIMSVLGAVVMPHNLFLHSEVIQSRQWNLKEDAVIRRQLKYEMMDTLLAMLAGWAINSAIIIMAAAAFHSRGETVTEIAQAGEMLRPLLGGLASAVFALALLFSGISSSVTSGMAGGSIMAGMYGEPLNLRDPHSRFGMLLSLLGALVLIFFVTDPFKGLVYSQMALSMQLPFTIVLQLSLTSSEKVMGRYANTRGENFWLWLIAAVVIGLNVKLLLYFF